MKVKETSIFKETIPVDLLGIPLEIGSLVCFSKGGKSSGVSSPQFCLIKDIVFKDGVRSQRQRTMWGGQMQDYWYVDNDLIILKPILYSVSLPGCNDFYSSTSRYTNLEECWPVNSPPKFDFVRLQHYEVELYQKLEKIWKQKGKTREDYFPR